jgi:hypothetical protein
MVEVRLLELFVDALGGGEQSLLYKALVDRKTRALDSGVTSVSSWVGEQNSPLYPFVAQWLSGIPGSRITPELIERLRSRIIRTIQEISVYPPHSKELEAFNRLVHSHEHAARRYESVWIRNAPGFGLRQTSAAWKSLLDALEMDPSFNRSLSEDETFRAIEKQLDSGENIWANLIQKFHLLETPYSTASTPSPELLEQIEKNRQERLAAKTKALMQQYNTSDDQQALALFEQDELVKTRQVETIEAKVQLPQLTGHPPLTLDDDIHYRQTTLSGVPVIAAMFDRSPTIDIGLCFDLRNLPGKYYKYLPLLPRFVDGVGLKEGTQTLTYADVLEQIQRDVYDLSVGYESNALSHRADFAIRASAANPEEFRIALRWIERLLKSNDLNMENADRLRDVVQEAVSADDYYTKQAEENCVRGPAIAFRYQTDKLFLALNSHFTQAHWRSRMLWLLHAPVAAEGIEKLGAFANDALLSLDKLPRRDVTQRLEALKRTGLEGELVDYWKKNLPSFADAELAAGLRQLTAEVEEDLKAGRTQADH